MKILVDYSETSERIINIEQAIYLNDNRIEIFFNDGTQKVIDFKAFLSNSIHPSIHKYLKKDIFSAFKIVDGNLVWNDYDMIFPIEDLYEGNI